MPDPDKARVRVYATHSTHKTLTALRQGSMIHVHDQDFEHNARNTVLFMIPIGMSRGTIAHLVNVLTEIARDLDDKRDRWSKVELKAYDAQVRSLTQELPPLPNFSCFHPAFLTSSDSTTPEGDLRRAFYRAYDDKACDFIKLEDGSLLNAIEAEQEVVSAAFITPYPPGFPVLVPGQVITREIVQFLMALDEKEIHGYEPAFGLRVFTAEDLRQEDERTNGQRITKS